MISTDVPISLLCTRSPTSCPRRRLGPSEWRDGEPGSEKEATRPAGQGHVRLPEVTGPLCSHPQAPACRSRPGTALTLKPLTLAQHPHPVLL